MPKLLYHVATSVDGFIARRDGTFSDFPDGDHVPAYLAELKTYAAVIMGRATYEVGLRMGVTDPYPWLDTYVVSTTLAKSPDPKVTLVRDPVEAARALRERAPGPVYLAGGGVLASALFDAGLVDEVIVKHNPLVLGDGIPLFAGLRHPARLRLLEHHVYGSGVVRLRYAVETP